MRGWSRGPKRRKLFAESFVIYTPFLKVSSGLDKLDKFYAILEQTFEPGYPVGGRASSYTSGFWGMGMRGVQTSLGRGATWGCVGAGLGFRGEVDTLAGICLALQLPMSLTSANKKRGSLIT